MTLATQDPEVENPPTEGTSTGESVPQRPRGPRRGFSPRRTGTGCGPRCIGRQSPPVSYKEVRTLERFISSAGKIRPRRQTGNCAKHQRMLAQTIKRARYMALLPFAPGHDFTSER